MWLSVGLGAWGSWMRWFFGGYSLLVTVIVVSVSVGVVVQMRVYVRDLVSFCVGSSLAKNLIVGQKECHGLLETELNRSSGPCWESRRPCCCPLGSRVVAFQDASQRAFLGLYYSGR